MQQESFLTESENRMRIDPPPLSETCNAPHFYKASPHRGLFSPHTCDDIADKVVSDQVIQPGSSVEGVALAGEPVSRPGWI